MPRKRKLEIKIPTRCRPKKNSQRIIYNKFKHKPQIIQGEKYIEFEKACKVYLLPIAKTLEKPIDYPINLKCTLYFPDRRRCDTVNMLNAIQDILIKYGILEDDNYNIVASLDGTRAYYEKGREEIIIEIEEI